MNIYNNMNDMSVVSSLPNEILSHIATFFSPTDLKNCNSVCERLGATCRDYTLWRRFFVDVNTSHCPEGRLCHTSVVHGDNMYIYGGHITQPSSEYFHTVKNDLYVCNIKTREWSEIPASVDAPRRTEHTAVVHDNHMVIFGGYSGTGSGYESSVMTFDFTTHKWETLITEGESPSARSAHTCVVVGHKMYVFGGWNGLHCMNDLHELDFQTKTWTLLCCDTSAASRLSGSANHRHSIFASPEKANANAHVGDLPSARCSHGAIIMNQNNNNENNPVMYVFGGYAIEGANESSNKGYLDDLYEFHFNTNKWYKTNTYGQAPSPRSRFRMISYKDSLYLFAGWNSAKHFSTLHKFCISNGQWTEVATNFDLDGIGQFSMVEHGGIMYVFSGFSPSQGCRSNLFAYHLAPAMNQQAR